MGAITLKDFKYGMDRRRKRVASLPGTLWVGKNVQISRGGDIERPRRLTPTYSLPFGSTFGLAAVQGQLYVFGSASMVAVPNGVLYQQLVSATGSNMVAVLDVKAFSGNLYVIARYDDGNVYHFYNGSRVTDWDTLADTNFTYTTLAAYMAGLIGADGVVATLPVGSTILFTALVPGIPFTIAASSTDKGGTPDQTITVTHVQANVAAVAEVRATSMMQAVSGSSGQVKQITANGTPLMEAPVPWTTDAPTTAALVSAQINDLNATHGYTASVVGSTVTVQAPMGLGATANGFACVVTTTGNVVFNAPQFDSGVTAVAPVAQVEKITFGGTPESTDIWVISIDSVSYFATGRASTTGTSLYVSKGRMWSPALSLFNYSQLNGPSNWSDATTSTGAGFINIANDAEGGEPLIGAGIYQTNTAIFSRKNCRIYSLDADSSQIQIVQALDNVGTAAARVILNYGAIDLFYLDASGLRSLRQRDASGAAFVNDIGTAIDTFLRAHMDTLTLAAIQKARGAVEPRDGRFWLALDGRVYILSYFPGSNISAWTYLEPGFTVTDFARIYDQFYIRGNNDTIYLYGGQTGEDWPAAGELPPQVDLPFVAMDPPTMVAVTGIDVALTNTWQMNLLTDPNNEGAVIDVGTFDEISYPGPDTAAPGRSTHFALSLTCSSAGEASISNITIHHDGEEPNQ